MNFELKSPLSLLLLLAMALPVGLVSCSEDDSTHEEFAGWEQRNRQTWDSLYTAAQKLQGQAGWRAIRNYTYGSTAQPASTGYILARALPSGTAALYTPQGERPIYTDTVLVHYYGRLLPSPSYPEGYLFDRSYSSTEFDTQTSAPAKFAVNALTDGFATALQQMRVGDHWEIYVPWTLAYGESGSSSIPGFSVLKFDITLVGDYHAGTPVPDFR